MWVDYAEFYLQQKEARKQEILAERSVLDERNWKDDDKPPAHSRAPVDGKHPQFNSCLYRGTPADGYQCCMWVKEGAGYVYEPVPLSTWKEAWHTEEPVRGMTPNERKYDSWVDDN